MKKNIPEFPFNSEILGANPNYWLKKSFPFLMRLFRLHEFNEIYSLVSHHSDAKGFLDAWVKEMNITSLIEEKEYQHIPRNGKLIIVANHALGGLDSLLLASLLTHVCDNPKIIGNFLFHKLPQMRSLIIGVDPFNGSNSTQFNFKGMKEVISWVKADNQLGVFPSGEVAHFKLNKMRVVEPPWDPRIAKLIRLTKADVLPVHFSGNNSIKFHFAGLLHPLLRTLLLPSELTNKHNAIVPIRIGTVIKNADLLHFNNDKEMIEHLRKKTYQLNQGVACS